LNNIKEVFRYVLAGLINTAVGYGVFLFLVYFISLSAYYANAIGYFFGLCTAFILNKYFVFNTTHTSIEHLFKFVISFFIAYAINVLILFICLNILNLSPAVGQIFAMFFYTISFYILNKFLVFRKKNNG